MCYTEDNEAKNTDWKICLLDTVVNYANRFFTTLLNHSGKQRLLQEMHRYFQPDLRRRKIDNVHCDACQRFNVDEKGFSRLPAGDVRSAPWEQVDTALIGPLRVKTKTGRIHEFSALTSIPESVD